MPRRWLSCTGTASRATPPSRRIRLSTSRPTESTLETLADLKKYAARIYAQTVQNKAMPLGNQTHMTDDERAALGRWLKALP